MIYTEAQLMDLAYTAVQNMLEPKPVTITHAAGWERHGFPLPIERKASAADGTVTQDYRPIAILSFVDDCVKGRIPEQKK